jgi:ribosome-associated protein
MTQGEYRPTTPSKPPRSGASASVKPGVLDREGARAFAAAAARSLIDDRCEDVLILDIADHSTVTGCIVIGTGTSERQMRAAVKHLETTGERFGVHHLHVSSDDNATWVLADYVDVVVHLFEPNARAFYDLESMWPDAPRLPAEEPNTKPATDPKTSPESPTT